MYVDYEHVAVAHSRMTLAEEGADSWAGIIHEDYRHSEAILNHEITRRLLDFTQPVCVIMASVLQFIGSDDQPADLIARYTASLAPGSWFAASHLAVDDADEGAAEIRGMFDSYTRAGNPAWLRDRAEFTSWFDGLELVSPGIVHAVDWRPDEDPDTVEASRAIRPFYWAGAGKCHHQHDPGRGPGHTGQELSESGRLHDRGDVAAGSAGVRVPRTPRVIVDTIDDQRPQPRKQQLQKFFNVTCASYWHHPPHPTGTNMHRHHPIR